MSEKNQALPQKDKKTSENEKLIYEIAAKIAVFCDKLDAEKHQ